MYKKLKLKCRKKARDLLRLQRYSEKCYRAETPKATHKACLKDKMPICIFLPQAEPLPPIGVTLPGYSKSSSTSRRYMYKVKSDVKVSSVGQLLIKNQSIKSLNIQIQRIQAKFVTPCIFLLIAIFSLLVLHAHPHNPEGFVSLLLNHLPPAHQPVIWLPTISAVQPNSE